MQWFLSALRGRSGNRVKKGEGTGEGKVRVGIYGLDVLSNKMKIRESTHCLGGTWMTCNGKQLDSPPKESGRRVPIQ